MKLGLRLRPERFTLHRLPADRAPDPALLAAAPWISVTRTQDEISILAAGALDLAEAKVEPDWSCLQVEGTLDLGLVGILAELAGVLARAGISLFTISTYDTDYLFVRARDAEAAVAALSAAGHRVARGPA